ELLRQIDAGDALDQRISQAARCPEDSGAVRGDEIRPSPDGAETRILCRNHHAGGIGGKDEVRPPGGDEHCQLSQRSATVHARYRQTQQVYLCRRIAMLQSLRRGLHPTHRLLRSLLPGGQILFLLRRQPVDPHTHRLELEPRYIAVDLSWDAVDLSLQVAGMADHVLGTEG